MSPTRIEKLGIRARNALVSRALILHYHRVSDGSEPDPFGLKVTTGHFSEHLDVLNRTAPVLPLAELLKHLSQGSLPRRSVVVTFDDGYVDNLVNAKPSLERRGIPATVFVTAGYIGRPWFWWDRLAQIVLGPPALPSRIRLAGRKGIWEWRSDSGEKPVRQTNTDKEASEPLNRVCFDSVYDYVKRCDLDEKEELLEQLTSFFPETAEVPRPGRPCTESEICRLNSGDLISIGAHTFTHPVLSALSPEEQLSEMRESRARLEQLTAQQILDFAYPFGKAADVDEASIRAAELAGFRSACSGVRGTVEMGSLVYQLPRVYVGDQDGEAFERLLARQFAWTRSPKSVVLLGSGAPGR